MALSIKDGNAASQVLPNSGIDPVYYAQNNGTITTTATSATDVFQLVGAAGIIARIRRIKVTSISVIAASTVAAQSTLVRVMRRTTAGTTGTWTALAESGGNAGRWQSPAGTAAAASVVANIAGTTAFTVGSGTQMVAQGYASAPSISAVTTFAGVPGQNAADFNFGINGAAPLYLVGAADFIVVNLNAVTPVGALVIEAWWDEAAV
jgi:hypothetical protein